MQAPLAFLRLVVIYSVLPSECLALPCLALQQTTVAAFLMLTNLPVKMVPQFLADVSSEVSAAFFWDMMLCRWVIGYVIENLAARENQGSTFPSKRPDRIFHYRSVLS
jgi:hypothetical protein